MENKIISKAIKLELMNKKVKTSLNEVLTLRNIILISFFLIFTSYMLGKAVYYFVQ